MNESKWQRPAPRPLNVMFKYLKAEHAQLMVRNGQIRITTLHECRSWDNPELGDLNEGKGILRQIIQDKEFTSENPMPGPLGSMINARNIKVGHISGSWEMDMPDVYMYCATLEASRKVMLEFGYDTCVRITHPWRFIECVSEQLVRRKLIPLIGFVEANVPQPRIIHLGKSDTNDCFYESRERDWLEGQPPQWLVKDPKFAHQKEIRTVWEPCARPIEAVFVESLRAASYCEFYDIPD